MFVTLVGDDRDHSTDFRDPAGDDADTRQGVGVRYAYPSTSSNVAGSVAAALALTAARSAGARRDELVGAARDWYEAARATNALVPIDDPNVGDYYPDDIFTDDLAFAALELYRVTGDAGLLAAADQYFRSGDDDPQLYAGTTPGSVGPVVAADLCGGLGAATPAGSARRAGCQGLRKVVSAARERARASAFGSPGIFTFGWVQDNGGTGAVAAAAQRARVAPDGLRIAAGARDYALGRNPWGASFVVGPGRNEARSPHHAAYLKGRPARLLSGAVVGGPADPGSLRAFGLRPAPSPLRRFNSKATVYEDRRADFVTSEVGLSYSASAILLAASLGGRQAAAWRGITTLTPRLGVKVIPLRTPFSARRPTGSSWVRSSTRRITTAISKLGEARAQAAARAAAEGQPGVGVGRVVAEEALRAELARSGVAVAAAVDGGDRRVDLDADRDLVAAEPAGLAAHHAARRPEITGLTRSVSLTTASR